MITISLCMIVKNEEDVIGRCLSSVEGIADEIIIVDTGSTDKTKDIAKKYTDKIYDYKWNCNFADARNYSFSKATKDYWLWLDADDVILEKDRENLKALKKNLDLTTDVVMMIYNLYDGKSDDHTNPLVSFFRERLIKRNQGIKWEGAVHEAISRHGNVIYRDDIAISHKKLKTRDSERDLNIFQKMILRGETFTPRDQFYYARELYYHKKYKEAIKMFEKFLNNPGGWVENKIDACMHLNYCYTALNEFQKGLHSLFRSFEYDIPRAEICCEIGKYFLNIKSYPQAILWYETAANSSVNKGNGGFVTSDYYDYIPNLQLCVCYYNIGEYEKAKECNKKAMKVKPNSKECAYNLKFFEGLKN